MVFQNTLIESKSNLLLSNSILRANISNGYCEKSLKLYVQMRKMGVFPDGFTLPLGVRACASMGEMWSPQLCKTVHGNVVVSGLQSHLHVLNELNGVYSKIGCLDYSTLLRIELEGFEPNIVTWTTLLSVHARCGRHEEAIVYFSEFRKRGSRMSEEEIAVVLLVCADADAFNKGKELRGYIVSSGFQDYIIVKNSLIWMYGKHEILNDVTALFLEMEVKSLVRWNTLISSFAEAGYCEEAFEVFSQLEMLNGETQCDMLDCSNWWLRFKGKRG
ncbi:hypothetical protein GIB67_026348 [Kingdonia uniflora]|uniref:Pentatricopeptide repeat-containing protein n=1 Tax=Kingdonia uniflora TaxID=39325 RepID=A0A7J7P685_9MAGN|nr:hypothetical protein GIB67_026348 [Kingdonia uniflora]